MKKNILLILIMLFLITGCSNAKLSNKTLVKLNGAKVSINDYYDSFKKDHINEIYKKLMD